MESQPRASGHEADRVALALHYAEGEALYKFWASPSSVLSAIALGWERSRHPAQLHYGWDLGKGLSLDQSIRYPTGLVLEQLGLHNDCRARVLELGCGLGGCAADFEERAPHVDLVGLSIVARQVEIARRRNRAHGLNNARYMVADFARLPFADEAFHAAFAIESLCHADPATKTALLAGIRRTLKPGGRLAILDGYRNPAVGRPDLVPSYEAMKLGWAFPDLVSSEQLIEDAERAGLDCVSCMDATERILAASRRIASIASPLLAISRRVASILEADLLRRFRSSLQRATGLLTAFSIPMLEAAVSQHRLFSARFLNYHVHVLTRPRASSMTVVPG